MKIVTKVLSVKFYRAVSRRLGSKGSRVQGFKVSRVRGFEGARVKRSFSFLWNP